jgi:hypothetical protein
MDPRLAHQSIVTQKTCPYALMLSKNLVSATVSERMQGMCTQVAIRRGIRERCSARLGQRGHHVCRLMSHPDLWVLS